MRHGQDGTSRIAPGTLALAAVGSASATFLLGRFGLAGTVTGAALTPVIVALVSEMVRRPAKTVTVRTAALRVTEPGVRRPERRVTRVEPRPGLSLDRVPWKRVAVTGVAAFLVVVAAVSIADLASGGSVASGRGSTFFTPSDSSPEKSPGEQPPATPAPSEQQTEPAEEEEEAPPAEEPAETEPAPTPTETAPTETTTP